MTTVSTPDNDEHVPKIWERDQIIILSHDKECQCGRTKDKPHCPKCGSVQVYPYARTFPVKLKNGDVMKGCIKYRCIKCNHHYNDIGWYFECFAKPEIDYIATRKLWRERERRDYMEWWRDRIIAHYHNGQELKPTYNDLRKFESQVGGSFEEFAKAMVDIERDKENRRLKEENEQLNERLRAGLTESGFKYPVIKINDPDDSDDPDKKGG